MNRQEALEKLKNFYYWNYCNEEYNREAEEKHKQNLEEIIKYLKQPVSLVDFLGGEEGVEYIVCDKKYKIIDNKLYRFDGEDYEWRISVLYDRFIEFQQVAKNSLIKYNLILQSGYRKLFNLQENEKYLTICIQDGDVFQNIKHNSHLKKLKKLSKNII